MGAVYVWTCADNQSLLLHYQTRTRMSRLPWLLRKNKLFKFEKGALDPTSFDIRGLIRLSMCGWSSPLNKPNRIAEAALAVKKKQALPIWIWTLGPTSFDIWGRISLSMCEWSNPIDGPNQNQVVALAAKGKKRKKKKKKKHVLQIWILALGPTSFDVWACILQLITPYPCHIWIN